MFLNGEDIIKNPPLFGIVKGVESNDVLNIRKKPDYRSKRVGYLSNEAIVKVYKCKKINSKSTWCKIGHMTLYDYDGYGYGVPDGWVNAKFLDTYNNGYVLVNNEGNCYYSLGCKDGICDVLIDIDIKKIKRDKLLGVSRFEAFTSDSEDEGGEDPCNPNMLHLRMPKEYKNTPKLLVKDTLEWINFSFYKQIKRHIHPKKGVLISYYTTFNRLNNHFTQESFIKAINSDKKLYWGKSEGKGDKIYISLNEFFDSFRYLGTYSGEVDNIKRVSPNKFYFPRKNVRVYEVVNKEKEEHEWVNPVIVVEKYKDDYYIVGILYNRWSI
jgi:hypothetical protein